MSKDIIFEEMHEYHKEMWDFLAKNPYKTKKDFLELHYNKDYVKIDYESYWAWDYKDKFYELIEDYAECFACFYAHVIYCEKPDDDPENPEGNSCFYCPITKWRKEAIRLNDTCPCLYMEFGEFERYSDEIGREEEIEEFAGKIRDMEWSIPEGEEI